MMRPRQLEVLMNDLENFDSGGSDRRQRPIASVGADFACGSFHLGRGRDWHSDTGVAHNPLNVHKLRFTA